MDRGNGEKYFKAKVPRKKKFDCGSGGDSEKYGREEQF